MLSKDRVPVIFHDFHICITYRKVCVPTKCDIMYTNMLLSPYNNVSILHHTNLHIHVEMNFCLLRQDGRMVVTPFCQGQGETVPRCERKVTCYPLTAYNDVIIYNVEINSDCISVCYHVDRIGP